jgi:hypothetical protein
LTLKTNRQPLGSTDEPVHKAPAITSALLVMIAVRDRGEAVSH